jgi:hypothetical protein
MAGNADPYLQAHSQVFPDPAWWPDLGEECAINKIQAEDEPTHKNIHLVSMLHLSTFLLLRYLLYLIIKN